MSDHLSEEELAARLKIICRELLERSGEPDFVDKAVAALAPYFQKPDHEY
jgi:hypothetical protein